MTAQCLSPITQYAVELTTTDWAKSSLQCLEEAVRLSPEHVGAWFQLGCAAEREGNFARAEQAYNAAAKLNCDFAPAYENLGLMLWERGDKKGAQKAFKELARIADKDQPKRSPVAAITLFFAAIGSALVQAGNLL
jgi:cytochrome c-type biogenesis protein CcmH/NrfG